MQIKPSQYTIYNKDGHPLYYINLRGDGKWSLIDTDGSIWDKNNGFFVAERYYPDVHRDNYRFSTAEEAMVAVNESVSKRGK